MFEATAIAVRRHPFDWRRYILWSVAVLYGAAAVALCAGLATALFAPERAVARAEYPAARPDDVERRVAALELAVAVGDERALQTLAAINEKLGRLGELPERVTVLERAQAAREATAATLYYPLIVMALGAVLQLYLTWSATRKR